MSNLKSATQYSYTIEAISGIQVKKLPGTILTICTPDWQCTEWSSCESSHQTRACGDLNRCGVSTAKPISTQSCTMPAPQPTANVTVSTQSLNTQTVQPGNNVVLGKINITYDNEVRHKIAEKPLRLTVGGGGSTSNLSNCRLFNSNAGLVVSAAIYGPVTGKNIFSTDVDGLLDVVCDVANNTSNGSTFSWGINSNDWSNVFEAMYNYSLENDITTSMGQTVTVIN